MWRHERPIFTANYRWLGQRPTARKWRPLRFDRSTSVVWRPRRQVNVSVDVASRSKSRKSEISTPSRHLHPTESSKKAKAKKSRLDGLEHAAATGPVFRDGWRCQHPGPVAVHLSEPLQLLPPAGAPVGRQRARADLLERPATALRFPRRRPPVVLGAPAPPERQLRHRLRVQFPTAAADERARATGPGVPALLPRRHLLAADGNERAIRPDRRRVVSERVHAAAGAPFEGAVRLPERHLPQSVAVRRPGQPDVAGPRAHPDDAPDRQHGPGAAHVERLRRSAGRCVPQLDHPAGGGPHLWPGAGQLDRPATCRRHRAQRQPADHQLAPERQLPVSPRGRHRRGRRTALRAQQAASAGPGGVCGRLRRGRIHLPELRFDPEGRGPARVDAQGHGGGVRASAAARPLEIRRRNGRPARQRPADALAAAAGPARPPAHPAVHHARRPVQPAGGRLPRRARRRPARLRRPVQQRPQGPARRLRPPPRLELADGRVALPGHPDDAAPAKVPAARPPRLRADEGPDRAPAGPRRLLDRVRHPPQGRRSPAQCHTPHAAVPEGHARRDHGRLSDVDGLLLPGGALLGCAESRDRRSTSHQDAPVTPEMRVPGLLLFQDPFQEEQ